MGHVSFPPVKKVKLVTRSLARALICLALSLEIKAREVQSVFLIQIGGTGNNWTSPNCLATSEGQYASTPALEDLMTNKFLDWRQAPYATSLLKKPWLENWWKSSEPYLFASKGINSSGDLILDESLKSLKQVGKEGTSLGYLACI
jgi:hypothetical protein